MSIAFLGPVSELTQPLRHTATLGSLSCWLCGAGPFTECDIAAHQEYANARYPCASCGAVAGEVCRAGCPAADTLIEVLTDVHEL